MGDALDEDGIVNVAIAEQPVVPALPVWPAAAVCAGRFCDRLDFWRWGSVRRGLSGPGAADARRGAYMSGNSCTSFAAGKNWTEVVCVKEMR